MTDMKPTIQTGKRMSSIWIIPIVALLIGVSMVVHTQLSQGPTISIDFQTAEGLAAGKTKVEYLNVHIGLVEEVKLNKDMNGVTAIVQLDRAAKSLLKEDTQFWVVRARVGAGNVSGLGTILSGAYIELSPGQGKLGERHFTGLETPPLTPVGAPGVKLNLYSEQAGSVSTGDSVLYNGFKVGRVEGMSFDGERALIRYDVFIDAPYDQLVTSSVRFWDVSGIAVKASADGVEIKTGSFDTVVLGGVAFSVPEGLPKGERVDNGVEFKLYQSFSDIQKQPFRYHFDVVMTFQDSLRGLVVGAPVEYRGIEIGSVKRIMPKKLLLKPDRERGAAIPVLISIEPGRLELPDTQASLDLFKETLGEGVEEGLRGSLETGSLITGSLFVSMDYFDDLEPLSLGEFEGYSVVPTVSSGLGRIEAKITKFLDTLNALPLEKVLNSVDTTLVSATDTFESIDEILNQNSTRQLPQELVDTLEQLRRTLAQLAPEAAAGQSLSSSINELNQTLHNLEGLTRTLSDNPNALVLPTNFPDDPQPEAKR